MFCCHRVKSESPDVFSAEMDKRKLFVKWSKNAIVMSCSVWDIMLEDHKAAKKKWGQWGEIFQWPQNHQIPRVWWQCVSE